MSRIKWEFHSFYDFVASHITFYETVINSVKVFKSVQTYFDAHGPYQQVHLYMASSDHFFSSEHELINHLNK